MSTASPTLPSLRTLAESKTEGVSKSTTFRVDPNLIKFEKGFNLRTDGPELDEHIERLYQAYKSGDQVPAIDVHVVGENIVARDGHCRTKAAKRLRKEMPDFTLECRQFRGNDTDAIVHMLGTGTGSRALTPLEAGIGYLRLIKMGLTPVQIAEKIHVSRVTVDNGITLAEAPAEVQKMITGGDVSATVVRDAIKQGPAAVKALKEKVKEARENPAPAKKSNGSKPDKKKKVTAKALRGTAADKTKKVKKKKALAVNEVSFTLEKYAARIVADALAEFEDETIKAFVATLETALL